MSARHLNWIGARWSASSTEQYFDVATARAPAQVAGSFARSSAGDVAQALAHNAALGAAWFDCAARERRAILARACAALVRDPDPGARIAHALGLDPQELARHHAGLEASLEQSLSGELAPRAWRASTARAGCVLFAPGWSELWHAPARVLFSLLERGQGVLVCSDPALPFVAHALIEACAHAGLPSGVVALLHDDGESTLRAAFARAEISAIIASGPPARMRRLDWLRRHVRAQPDASRTPGAASNIASAESIAAIAASSMPGRANLPFGAGVEDAQVARVELESLRNATQLVRRAEDPAQAALSAFERALGRSAALSGQHAGQIGRVLCHERLFSRFNAEFLRLVETHPDGEQPLALLEPATLAHVRRARALGLDEGATLLLRNTASGAPAQRSPAADADARLWPTIFTNVEPHMRLAWLGRPAPVVCLMRVRDDEAGERLKAEFDGSPSPEDLSTASRAFADDAR